MNAAERILAEMRLKRHGWKPQHFKTLYEGFGFERREGGNHTRYKHRQYRHLIATVARHKKLDAAYADDAISLIDEVIRRKAQEEADDDKA